MFSLNKLLVFVMLVRVTFASCKGNTGLTQMVTYVKRHPDWTRENFWAYWQTQHAPKVVPLATYFNITRYQQVQVGGQILPTKPGSETLASNELVEFDGIAMFLYESPDILTAMLSHPYYLEVVEPDEHNFIDKEAYGGGMVATFVGTHIEAVDRAKDVWVGNSKTRAEYRELFASYL
ncbi:unnamed protein product [Clonostachys byssicola]|uniref:EthD domain-containing protein n=1 Tax=Clonostachys byssicola TaxID=160290 RepID=A0A9N9U8H3_9HYPO|nr:unnamed protein product [Clonostachys byssicola]